MDICVGSSELKRKYVEIGLSVPGSDYSVKPHISSGAEGSVLLQMLLRGSSAEDKERKMLSTLLQAVLFSFLTDFYTLYDFLSQLVLNFSHLAPDVPCGWVSQSCLGILLCSFLSLPFVERRSKLTV